MRSHSKRNIMPVNAFGTAFSAVEVGLLSVKFVISTSMMFVNKLSVITDTGSFESMAEAVDVRSLRAVVASDAHVLCQFSRLLQKACLINEDIYMYTYIYVYMYIYI